MYLSKITFSQTPAAKKFLLQLLTNRDYATHQFLWRLFTSAEKRHFLFREDITVTGEKVFFVLSPVLPENVMECHIQTKHWHPVLQTNDLLAFKLRLNPTICVSNTTKAARHDVLMHAKYQAKQQGITDQSLLKQSMSQAAQTWLMDKKRLDDWGIEFNFSPDIECYTQHQMIKKNGQLIQFSSIDIQGLLTVKNTTRFLAKMNTGFGRAKSFGCGLMLIRRP